MNTFCVSTASYSGYSLPEALASIERLGVENVEFVADQLLVDGEFDMAANYINEAFSATGLHCHSVAITNETLNFTEQSVLRALLDFTECVGAGLLILPTAPNKLLSELLYNIQAVTSQKPTPIKVLLENRGDQIDSVASDEIELERVVALLDAKGVAFAYNPANLFSNQPGIDLLRHAYSLVRNTEYIVAQDSVIKNRHYLSVPVGKGICRYSELFERFPSLIEKRAISVRYPHSQYRDRHGEARQSTADISLPELEKQLRQSIMGIHSDISESKLRM